jgi:hypothetical protein
MITAKGVCGRCEAKISRDATREVCPACLLQTGLASIADESVVGVAQPSRNEGVPAADVKEAAASPLMASDITAPFKRWMRI